MQPLTFTALGTSWWIEIFTPLSLSDYEDTRIEITKLLTFIENRFSRFLPHSLVGQLNSERTLATDDADFLYLINESRNLYQDTGGVFNILVGDALIARGYDAAYSLTPQDRPVFIGNPLTDLTNSNGRWQLATGLLDLGGIGKGWAIDQVAALLQRRQIECFLINGGGDMYSTSEADQPITIYLEHPTEAQTYIGTTTIFHQGFAASSTHKRSWRTSEGITSHIVDDIKQIDASYVTAQNALTADVLATCALLLPRKDFANLAANRTADFATLTLDPLTVITSKNFSLARL